MLNGGFDNLNPFPFGGGRLICLRNWFSSGFDISRSIKTKNDLELFIICLLREKKFPKAKSRNPYCMECTMGGPLWKGDLSFFKSKLLKSIFINLPPVGGMRPEEKNKRGYC